MMKDVGVATAAWMVAAMLAVSACGDAGAPQYLEAAKSHLEKGDAASAVVELRNAVREDPDLPESRYLMGLALLRSNDPAGAAMELQKALSLNFDRNLVVPELADALYQAGAYEKVITTLDAGPVTPAAAQATVDGIRGDTLLAVGQLDAARKAYEAALTADPAQERAKLGQIAIVLAGGDVAKAESMLTGTFGAEPTASRAWMLKAAMAERLGKIDAAIEAYEKAIERKPHNLAAYVTLIPYLITHGRVKDAEVRLAAMAKLAPGAAATTYADAVVSYAKGETTRARASIQTVLKNAPDDNRARLIGGMIEHDLGNYAMAEKLLTAVVRTSPGQARARYMLASTLMREGKALEAGQTLEPLLTAPNPAEPTLELAGDIALRLGDPQRAIDRFAKAIALDPKRAAPMIGRARAQIASGRFEAGIADFAAASTVDPSQVTSDVLAIDELLRMGLQDRAQTIANALVKRLPGQPAAHNALGRVASAKGDRAAAKAAFEEALSLDPKFIPAVKNLASAEMDAGDAAGAIARLRALVDSDPGKPEAVVMLVAALQRTGAPAEEVLPVIDVALRENVLALPLFIIKTAYLLGRGDNQGALDAALAGHAAFPGDPGALHALARTQLSAGDSKQALASFGKLAAATPKATAPLLGIAEAHAAQRRWPETRTALKRAIALAPDELPAHLGLVRASQAAADFAQAREDARVIQKKWPTRPEGWLHEAAALDRLKQAGAAEQVLRSGIAASNTPEVLAALYRHLLVAGKADAAAAALAAWRAKHPAEVRGMLAAGEVHLARGEFAQASKWFRAVLDVRANDPVALNNLAWALGKQGDRTALEIGMRAIAAAPNAAGVLDTVGMLNVQFGNRDEGIRQLESAVARAPADPQIRLNLARSLIAADRKPDARLQLEAASRLKPSEADAKVIAELIRTL
jgi:putative PEP-CTERM system TPR-repeat lipoprotein